MAQAMRRRNRRRGEENIMLRLLARKSIARGWPKMTMAKMAINGGQKIHSVDFNGVK
jgi:hypothetical protein